MSTAKDKQRANDRRMGLTFAAVLVVAVIIFGGGAYLFTRAFTGHVKTVADYETMELEAASYSSTVQASGSFESGNTTTVRSEVDGSVANVAVKDGDVVKKGDTLFTIENEDITADFSTTLDAYVKAQDEENAAIKQVTSGKAKLKQAQKTLTKAQTALDKARADAEQSDEADATGFNEEPYQAAVEAAQSNVDSAQETLDVLQENKTKAAQATEAAKVAYKKAAKKVSKLTVKASVGGTIASLAIEKGSAVTAASDTAAMKIVDTGDIVVVVEVPESQIANIAKGQSATVSCPSLDNASCKATVARVADTPVESDQNASLSSQTASTSDGAQDPDNAEQATAEGAKYQVTLKLKKHDSAVKIGMSANADITVQDFGTVFYVPSTCVATGNSGSYVEAVVDKSTVKQCGITQLGTADDGKLIIQGASLADGTVIRTDLSNS